MYNRNGEAGLIKLKRNDHDMFDGKMDYSASDTWLFNLDLSLALTQLSSPVAPLSDENKISFALSYLKGTS